MRKYDLRYILVLLFFLACVLLPHSPLFKTPYGDSAVFLYHGQQILEGKIPYVDLFDNKPPLIFYLNALGLWIGNGSIWGVWSLEYLFLVLSSVIGFLTLTKYIDKKSAAFSTYFWLISLVYIHDGGNFPEVYALLFQFLALYLFWDGGSNKSYSVQSFFLGVTLSLTLLLKQNIIGIHVAAIFLISITRLRNKKIYFLFKELLFFTIGTASILIIVALYFYFHNALFQFWDTAFQYNFEYVEKPLIKEIRSAYYGFKYLTATGISIVATLVWFFILMHIMPVDRYSENRPLKVLAHLAFVLFPMVVMFVSISGRSYIHYYISWLPALFVLSSLFFYYLFSLKSNGIFLGIFASKRSSILLAISFVLATSIVPIGNFEYWFNRYSARRQSNKQIVSIIDKYSDKSDFLFVWGLGSEFNLLTTRKSPTRFFCPFFQVFHASESRLKSIIPEILSDIKEKKPRIIIDQFADWPNTPPIDPRKRSQWAAEHANGKPISTEISELFDYIYGNYVRLDEDINGYDYYILPSK